MFRFRLAMQRFSRIAVYTACIVLLARRLFKMRRALQTTSRLDGTASASQKAKWLRLANVGASGGLLLISKCSSRRAKIEQLTKQLASQARHQSAQKRTPMMRRIGDDADGVALRNVRSSSQRYLRSRRSLPGQANLEMPLATEMAFGLPVIPSALLGRQSL